MGRRGLGLLVVAAALFVVAPVWAALIEPRAMLAAAAIALLAGVLWLGVSVLAKALAYRKWLEFPGGWAFLCAGVGTAGAVSAAMAVTALLNAGFRQQEAWLMTRSAAVADAAGLLLWLVLLVGSEVGLVLLLNTSHSDRRCLLRVAGVTAAVMWGLPVVLLISLPWMSASARGGTTAPRLAPQTERQLPIRTFAGVGSKTTEAFRATEPWYAEWWQPVEAGAPQPIRICLVRDRAWGRGPERELRTAQYLEGQSRGATEVVQDKGWFRLKVEVNHNWQIDVYRATRPPGAKLDTGAEAPRSYASPPVVTTQQKMGPVPPAALDGEPPENPAEVGRFHGAGDGATPAFTVQSRWRVIWRSLAPSSPNPMGLTIAETGQVVRTPRVLHGNTLGVTEVVRERGTFRLKVQMTGPWEVAVYSL